MKNKLRVTELCKDQGLTQEELAQRLGISRIALSKCLNGNPTIETLDKIAIELNIPIWQLFKGYKDSFVAMVKSGDTLMCTYDPDDLIRFVETMKKERG